LKSLGFHRSSRTTNLRLQGLLGYQLFLLHCFQSVQVEGKLEASSRTRQVRSKEGQKMQEGTTDKSCGEM